MTAKEAVESDLLRYKSVGGEVSYPFPVEDFALRTFDLDVQYEDFDLVFESHLYDPGELFGCLFPDGRPFQGLEKVILVNSNRRPFVLAGKEVPREYYQDYAERQTVAHEIGHYSDLWVHHVESQKDLFDPKIFADAPTSIIVYPSQQETFSNKYQRELLMPTDEVMRLLHTKNLSGTIDLRATMGFFVERFMVTHYMIEIRLKELGIHFLNGIYIKNRNRYPYQRYTCDDLVTLIDIAKDYSQTHPYYDADNYAKAYNMQTGQTRASGALYMTLWRILQGKYDNRCPEVFEKRIVDLAELSADDILSDNSELDGMIDEEG